MGAASAAALLLACGVVAPAQAYPHDHRGHVHLGLWWGGWWGPYDPWWGPPPVVVVPQGVVPAAPAVPAPPPPPDPVFQPRQGQGTQQTEADVQACNRWATTQAAAMRDAQVFQRAVAACMDGRGYTVR